MRGGGLGDLQVDRSRLNHSHPLPRIKPEDPVETIEPDNDHILNRQGTSRQAGTAAASHEGNIVPMAGPHRSDHLISALRKNHRSRTRLESRQGIGLIGRQLRRGGQQAGTRVYFLQFLEQWAHDNESFQFSRLVIIVPVLSLFDKPFPTGKPSANIARVDNRPDSTEKTVPSIEQIREKLQEEPDDVFLNYSLAMLQKKDGLDQEALASFDRCIELDPDYIAAYFHKGMYLASLGEVEQARTILETGIERARGCGDEHALGEMTEFLASL